MAPGQSRPTTKEGRHPLPTSRPTTRVPQPRAASAARDPRGSGAIAQSKAESLPVPQSAAMMRQTSTPYINRTAPLPYRNVADSKNDLEATITAVNMGRQRSNFDVKDEPIQQLSEVGDSSGPGQARIINGRKYSSLEWEAIVALVEMYFSIRANTQPPPASSKTQPKRKRDGDEEIKGKKAKEENEKPYKCNHCGEGFRRPDHVVRHEKSKHGNFREKFLCDICGKSISRKDNLSQHRKSIHPEPGPAPVPKSIFVTVNENGNETGIAEEPVTLAVPAADRAAHVGGEAAEPIDSRAQSVCGEAGDSESSSRQIPRCGRSTSTTSGSAPPYTTTETGSKFRPINKPR